MADVAAANAAQAPNERKPRAAAKPKPRLLMPSIIKVVQEIATKKPESATGKKRFVLELDDGEVQFDTVEEVLAFVAIYQQKRG